MGRMSYCWTSVEGEHCRRRHIVQIACLDKVGAGHAYECGVSEVVVDWPRSLYEAHEPRLLARMRYPLPYGFDGTAMWMSWMPSPSTSPTLDTSLRGESFFGASLINCC